MLVVVKKMMTTFLLAVLLTEDCDLFWLLAMVPNNIFTV